MTRTATKLVLAGLLVLAAAVDPAGAEQAPLRFGVLPFASPARLMDQFQHLGSYLEKRLDRRVDILSAPDYRDFAARTAAGRYDLVFTPPHFAALAIEETGYVPLVKTAPPFRPTIYVRRDGDVATLADLSGKTISAPNDVALVTIWCEKKLREQGLAVGRNLVFYYTPSHNNALLLLAHNVVDAAITVPVVARRMPAEIRDQIEPLFSLGETFAMTYLAAPTMTAGEEERLRHLLLAFPETPDGARFRQGTPGPVHAPLSVDEIRPYQGQTSDLKPRLSQKAKN